MKKGLMVYVLRTVDTPDSTNGGVTSRVGRAILVGTGVPEIFEPTEDMPLLMLDTRGGRPGFLRAVPADQPEGMAGPMFGGNFITSSDSRFPSDYPIPVHDRFDTWEHYERLSR